jgi:hypothetical protein
MVHDGYQYMLDFYRADGSAAGQVAITPDWGPALEWVHFQGVRQARLPAVTAVGSAEIEPLWHSTLGPPHLAAVRVMLLDGGGFSHDLPISYFRRSARQAASELVERGSLQVGENYRYLVSAFGAPAADASTVAAADFSVEEVAQPLPLHESQLASFLAAASPGSSGTDATDVPVFVHRQVLDEAAALAEAAGDFETGGVLVGKLHRDGSIPEVFIEVTAQIAAPHTRSESAKLTFTADTWTAVRAALALRKKGELMLGWHHYHPDFCRLRGCPPERRRVCTATSAFFSTEDVQLHHAVFGRAFQIALLISDNTADGLQRSFYGWRAGVVSERSFQILESGASDGSHDED